VARVKPGNKTGLLGRRRGQVARGQQASAQQGFRQVGQLGRALKPFGRTHGAIPVRADADVIFAGHADQIAQVRDDAFDAVQSQIARCEDDADDAEGLLVEWLGELAYWAERDGFVAPQVEWEAFLPTSLAATVRGGRPAELQKHIKAVTYHDLAIRPIGDGLEATIVFDV